MAVQPPVALPTASRVDYLGGDVDYIIGADPVGVGQTNRPGKNLAHRDYLLEQALNEAILRANNAFAGAALVAASDVGAATPRATLEDMVLQQHNANGSHKGGSPHPPVTIPGGAPLTLTTTTTEQQLGIQVGALAGMVCAGNDARLHSSSPVGIGNADHDPRYVRKKAVANDSDQVGHSCTGYRNLPSTTNTDVKTVLDSLDKASWAVVSDGSIYAGNFLTPGAALTAGARKIVVLPSLTPYSNVGAGAITISQPVHIIGIGLPVWQHDGVTLAPGASDSVIEQITFSGSTSTLTIQAGVKRMTLRRFGVFSTATACITITGDGAATWDNHYFENVTLSPNAGMNGISATTVHGMTIDGLDVTGVRSGGLPTAAAGVYISSGCVGWVVRRLDARCTAIGDATRAQIGFRFAAPATDFIFEDCWFSYVHAGIYGENLGGYLANIRIRRVKATSMATTVDILAGSAVVGVAGSSALTGVLGLEIDGLDVAGDRSGDQCYRAIYLFMYGGSSKGIAIDNIAAYHSLSHAITIETSAAVPTVLTDVKVNRGESWSSTNSHVFVYLAGTMSAVALANLVGHGTTILETYAVDIEQVAIVNCHVYNDGGGSVCRIATLKTATVGAAPPNYLQQVSVANCTVNGRAALLYIEPQGANDVISHIAVSGCSGYINAGTQSFITITGGVAATFSFCTITGSSVDFDGLPVSGHFLEMTLGSIVAANTAVSGCVKWGGSGLLVYITAAVPEGRMAVSGCSCSTTSGWMAYSNVPGGGGASYGFLTGNITDAGADASNAGAFAYWAWLANANLVGV